MPDEPFRFAISPIVTERNARRLVDIMGQFFPSGATSEELRIQFEKFTTLKRQSFYDTLNYAKYRRWIVGGGKSKPYELNSDGSWTPTQTTAGLILEKDRLKFVVDSQMHRIGELHDEVERLRDWSSGGDTSGAGVALSSLVRIVGDSDASTRQRIKAASAVLGYKVSDDSVVEFTKRFLRSICTSTDIAIDYRIEAGELLRRSEDAKIVPATERPPVRIDNAEPPIPLRDLVAQRKERADRMEREMVRGMAREIGLRSDDIADSDKLSSDISVDC